VCTRWYRKRHACAPSTATKDVRVFPRKKNKHIRRQGAFDGGEKTKPVLVPRPRFFWQILEISAEETTTYITHKHVVYVDVALVSYRSPLFCMSIPFEAEADIVIHRLARDSLRTRNNNIIYLNNETDEKNLVYRDGLCIRKKTCSRSKSIETILTRMRV